MNTKTRNVILLSGLAAVMGVYVTLALIGNNWNIFAIAADERKH